jgi:hypothetical protein
MAPLEASRLFCLLCTVLAKWHDSSLPNLAAVWRNGRTCDCCEETYRLHRSVGICEARYCCAWLDQRPDKHLHKALWLSGTCLNSRRFWSLPGCPPEDPSASTLPWDSRGLFLVCLLVWKYRREISRSTKLICYTGVEERQKENKSNKYKYIYIWHLLSQLVFILLYTFLFILPSHNMFRPSGPSSGEFTNVKFLHIYVKKTFILNRSVVSVFYKVNYNVL